MLKEEVDVAKANVKLYEKKLSLAVKRLRDGEKIEDRLCFAEAVVVEAQNLATVLRTFRDLHAQEAVDDSGEPRASTHEPHPDPLADD